MPTILVTGAAGFIGSHTCDQLLAAGQTVVGIDNFRTGKPENLENASRSAQFRFIEADIADGRVLATLVGACHPTAIVHLAALVSVPESIADPVLNFRLNLGATHLVAEAARRHHVPRIVFASSAAVYGETSTEALSETRAVCRPISPYGAAKLASEAVLLGHAAAFGLTVRCQRYFNVYGPRQDPRSAYSGVISVFQDCFRAGRAPTIYGDGTQSRDFISVGDVARANVLAALRPRLASGVANICTGRRTSLREILAALAARHPQAPEPVQAPARPGDIRHSLGDPAQARLDLGFSAEESLEDGLGWGDSAVEGRPARPGKFYRHGHAA